MVLWFQNHQAKNVWNKFLSFEHFAVAWHSRALSCANNQFGWKYCCTACSQSSSSWPAAKSENSSRRETAVASCPAFPGETLVCHRPKLVPKENYTYSESICIGLKFVRTELTGSRLFSSYPRQYSGSRIGQTRLKRRLETRPQSAVSLGLVCSSCSWFL